MDLKSDCSNNTFEPCFEWSIASGKAARWLNSVADGALVSSSVLVNPPILKIIQKCNLQRDVQTYPAIVVLYLRRLYRGPVWLAWPTSVHYLYMGLWRCRKSRGSGGKGVCIGKWNYLRKMDAFVYFYIIIWTIWWSFGNWSCRLLYAAVVPSRKLVTHGRTADYNSWSEGRATNKKDCNKLMVYEM